MRPQLILFPWEKSFRAESSLLGLLGGELSEETPTPRSSNWLDSLGPCGCYGIAIRTRFSLFPHLSNHHIPTSWACTPSSVCLSDTSRHRSVYGTRWCSIVCGKFLFPFHSLRSLPYRWSYSAFSSPLLPQLPFLLFVGHLFGIPSFSSSVRLKVGCCTKQNLVSVPVHEALIPRSHS